MTEQDPNQQLGQLMNDVVTPDAGARKRTVDAAVAAFSEKNPYGSQGSGAQERPTANVTTLRSRNLMTRNTWVSGGLASAAVVVLAVVLVFPRITPIRDDAGDVAPVVPAAGQIALSPPMTVDQATEAKRASASAASQRHSREQLAQERQARQKREVPHERPMLEADAFSRLDAELSFAPASQPNSAPRAVMRREMREARPDRLQAFEQTGNDDFSERSDNPVRITRETPVSTFSIDVDTASYSFVRRQLAAGVLPEKDAVRLEEMVNYFPYAYAPPGDRDVPFATHVSVVDSPWKVGNKLLHIAIKGFEAPVQRQRPANLVFLLDVSGSMNSPDKLPLVKQSLVLLLDQLRPEDTVALVVYAGAAGTVLPATPVAEKAKITAALGQLQAGGSTAGGAGIKLAYQLARGAYVEDGVNRVILATDGDFNVGIRSRDELQGFVERQRESGVYLSVLGFGQGNYKDSMMQALAQNGNGVAAYIDTLAEARKVLVDEAGSLLFPIAGDVKVQMEFNPAQVAEYRLLGYETRVLNREAFNNDKVDAGEIGAGHTVTAIYELTPVGRQPLNDPLRYGGKGEPDKAAADEYGYLKLRYKLPGESRSQLLTQSVPLVAEPAPELGREVRFAVAVAGFAQLLRGGIHTGNWGYDDALQLALNNRGDDVYGYRAEFTRLIRQAQVASQLQ